jgi:protein-S-isoprenylcysteine O-methyltransferase
MLAAAVAVFVVHSLAELVLRRGRAKRFERGRFDRGTTLLTTASWPAIVLGSLAARFLLDAGRPVADGAPSGQPLPGEPGWALVALMGLGAALRWWAMHTLGEFFTRTLTTLDGHRVVAAGPYRLIRHPGYLAQFLVLVPFAALIARSWIPALGALLLLGGVYARRIGLEERMLAERFGEVWTGYARRTWRLVPLLY